MVQDTVPNIKYPCFKSFSQTWLFKFVYPKNVEENLLRFSYPVKYSFKVVFKKLFRFDYLNLNDEPNLNLFYKKKSFKLKNVDDN